jgi:hypothetical protein
MNLKQLKAKKNKHPKLIKALNELENYEYTFKHDHDKWIIYLAQECRGCKGCDTLEEHITNCRGEEL